jgi:serine/threonine protein kinase
VRAGSYFCGAKNFNSPEIFKDHPYDKKSDMWSLGCILYELCALKPPFDGKNLKELRKNVLNGKYELIPDRYSHELRYIIKNLLRQDPAERCTADEMMANSFVKNRMKLWEAELWGTGEKESTGEMKKMLMKTITMKELSELKKSLPSPDYCHNMSIDTCQNEKIRTKKSGGGSTVRHSNDAWDHIILNNNPKATRVPKNGRKNSDRSRQADKNLVAIDPKVLDAAGLKADRTLSTKIDIPKGAVRDINGKPLIKDRIMTKLRDKHRVPAVMGPK